VPHVQRAGADPEQERSHDEEVVAADEDHFDIGPAAQELLEVAGRVGAAEPEFSPRRTLVSMLPSVTAIRTFALADGGAIEIGPEDALGWHYWRFLPEALLPSVWVYFSFRYARGESNRPLRTHTWPIALAAAVIALSSIGR
jgi:hypothetical protein